MSNRKGWTFFAAMGLGAAMLFPGAGNAAGVTETVCALALTDETGAIEFTNIEGLSVLRLTNKPGPFHLTAVNEKISAVQCARSDVVPAANDDKVVLAGYPLYISTERKDNSQATAVLEIKDGLFQMREIKGKLQPDEITRIAAQMDVFNDRLQKAGATQ